MMISILSATLIGLHAQLIRVEVKRIKGLPILILVGLLGKAIVESRERIFSALDACGVVFPTSRVIVNLAPADIPKSGSQFDVAIAIGIVSTMRKPKISLTNIVFLGELSLDGSIRRIPGAVALAHSLEKDTASVIIAPFENASELSLLTGRKILLASHLQEIMGFVFDNLQLTNASKFLHSTSSSKKYSLDTQVVGQLQAKRAMQISAAGAHNVLMVGPPGSGKSILAHYMRSLLPPLSIHERIEVISIHSLRGIFSRDQMYSRPFRSPHHSISRSGLLGGGSPITPGELSLAHHGVLFLDELPEFSRDCLEALRQPLEDGYVHITRSHSSLRFPAKCTVIAALNPCPCGFAGFDASKCSCTQYQIMKYRKKISGPLLDRLDIHLHIYPIGTELLQTPDEFSASSQEEIAALSQAIESACEIQSQRYQSATKRNAELKQNEIERWCPMSLSSRSFLNAAATSLSLSPRGYIKCIRIARTIADLSGAATIDQSHIAEAVQYRMRNGPY